MIVAFWLEPVLAALLHMKLRDMIFFFYDVLQLTCVFKVHAENKSKLFNLFRLLFYCLIVFYVSFWRNLFVLRHALREVWGISSKLPSWKIKRKPWQHRQDGQMGCGKALTQAHLLHYAAVNNWIIVSKEWGEYSAWCWHPLHLMYVWKDYFWFIIEGGDQWTHCGTVLLDISTSAWDVSFSTVFFFRYLLAFTGPHKFGK